MEAPSRKLRGGVTKQSNAHAWIGSTEFWLGGGSQKDTATGEGAVGLKQLHGHVDPLGLRRLAVVGQRQLGEVRQHNWKHDIYRRSRSLTGFQATRLSEIRTVVPEAGLRVGSDPAERPDDLHVQRVLVLVLRVLQERGQLHFHPLQQLHKTSTSHASAMTPSSLSVACGPMLTSFCVTVSMIVPKAGMVDILTELMAAGEQDSTVRDQAAGSLGYFGAFSFFRPIAVLSSHVLQHHYLQRLNMCCANIFCNY